MKISRVLVLLLLAIFIAGCVAQPTVHAQNNSSAPPVIKPHPPVGAPTNPPLTGISSPSISPNG